MRWIKGLVPTVIILLGALVLGCICYVSIWGAPSFVVQRVEQALMEKGIPVHIETLKISLWPRAVVTLKNVELLDPGVPPEARRPVALLHEADVALNWPSGASRMSAPMSFRRWICVLTVCSFSFR